MKPGNVSNEHNKQWVRIFMDELVILNKHSSLPYPLDREGKPI